MKVVDLCHAPAFQIMNISYKTDVSFVLLEAI